MLSFLYPLMWLAVPLLGIPLWLHLQRRNDSRTVRFSAMQFLDDQPLARQRPLLPRDLPLLLLRLLLVLLIIAAFAWPYVVTEDEVLIQESRVYILDNTLSNQAADRFVESRQTVADALASAGIDTQIAVVELAGQPRVLVQFGDDRATAARRVADLPPGHGRGSYAAAVRMAQSLLNQALGQRRQVVLLGDSQQNQWADDAGLAAFLEAVEVELPEPPVAELDNLAVRPPEVRRLSVGTQSVVQCSLRLYRQGRARLRAASVLVNGQELLREAVEMPARASEQTLLVELPDQPDTWLHGEVRLETDGDALEADNRAYFSLPPVRVGRVAWLADSIYLRTALAQQVIAGRWDTEQLAPASLAAHQPADVLVVESSYLAERPARELVQRYLDTGRGVALLVGDASPAASGLLREYGVELRADEPAESAPLRYVFLEHPIFQLFGSADTGALSEIRLQRFRRLQVSQGTPLAYAVTGDPVLADLTVGRGRLLVFAFRLDRDDTNWPLQASFLPFLDGCLKHLQAPSEPPASDYLPGETCVWTVPATDLRPAAGELQLELTRHGQAAGAMRVPIRDGQARFLLPDTPGSYDLRLAGDDRLQLVLNVNPPADESQLTYASGSETLEGWRREPVANNDDRAEPLGLSDLSRQQIWRQRLWWWLVATGLLALLVETLWVTRRLRSGATR